MSSTISAKTMSTVAKRRSRASSLLLPLLVFPMVSAAPLNLPGFFQPRPPTTSKTTSTSTSASKSTSTTATSSTSPVSSPTKATSTVVTSSSVVPTSTSTSTSAVVSTATQVTSTEPASTTFTSAFTLYSAAISSSKATSSSSSVLPISINPPSSAASLSTSATLNPSVKSATASATTSTGALVSASVGVGLGGISVGVSVGIGASATSTSSSTAAATASASTIPIAQASSCACGYVDDRGHIWREAITSDFTQGAMNAVNADWSVQTWAGQGNALNQQRTAANVYQDNGMLALKTSAYDGSGTTYTGQINTQRTDILYGSFRVKASVPNVPGVCLGFFSYDWDSEDESDIEFRSGEIAIDPVAYYTNQPAASNVIPSLSDLTSLNEHRFDWTATQTAFFVNGNPQKTATNDVPTHASQIMANVWSDGGLWTQGPPTLDAVGHIRYINLFFNSTSLDEPTFQKQCAAAGSVPICAV